MGRLLRGLALAMGGLVLAVLVLGTLAGLGRFLQVRMFPTAPPTEHDAQKAEYLAGIEKVDPEVVPRFVVIFFDDLGYGDLSSYGNELIDTPRIDALADEGVRMTTFYSASSVCTPSRAALLTGRYPVRTRTHEHVFFPDETPQGTIRRMAGLGNEVPRDEIMLPEVLKAAGYATGMIGKWHLGGTEGHLPNDFGFDSYYGVLWSNDMLPLHVYRNREIEIEDTTRVPEEYWAFRDEDSTFEREGGVDQTQLARNYTREAVAFLEKHKDEPFFLYLAHSFPHVPHFPDPEHAGESEGGVYGDVVEDLDRSTGEIVDALERLGLADDTVVIVTSDNGADYDGNPGPHRGRKGDTWEGGHKVPLIVRWPKVLLPGHSPDAPGMNIDLFPTILSIAGLPLPTDRVIDGRNLMDVWTWGSEGPHEYLYYFPGWGSEPDAVRDAGYKYLSATGQPGRSKPHLSVLGLDTENHNLISRHPEDADRLEAALVLMAAELEENPRGWQ